MEYRLPDSLELTKNSALIADTPRPVFQIILLVILYFFAARLGLMLAIPHGYAAAIWPASGLALAFLLLGGQKLWPGVLVGYFLGAFDSYLNPADAESIFRSVLQTLIIGTGATLQALLGAVIIRKRVDLNSGLIKAQDVLAFLLLGGPVACILSASWGVSTLWLMGDITSSQYLFSWFTWWVGDTIGVLLVVPFVFVWFGRPRRVWKQRKLPVALPLVVTLFGVVILFVFTSEREQLRISNQFNKASVTIFDAVENKLNRSLDVFYSVQNFFRVAETVSNQQFQSFVKHTMLRHADIRTISWWPVTLTGHHNRDIEWSYGSVSDNEEAQAGRVYDALLLIRDPERQSYVAVNEKGLPAEHAGMINEKTFKMSGLNHPMIQAAQFGKIVASPVANINKSRTDIIFFLPVYRSSDKPGAILQSTQTISGFVVGVLNTEELLDKALQLLSTDSLEVSLFDNNNGDKKVLLAAYSLDTRASIQGISEKFSYSGQFLYWDRPLMIAQKAFSLQVSTDASYLSNRRSWMPWYVQVAGFLFSASLGGLLLILTGGSITAQRLAQTDSLTRLYNRRYMEQIGRKLKDKNICYALLMLDIDHFKQVNDQWGHQCGDRVLQEISRQIQKQLRGSDFFGRWGGEEFLIYLPGASLEDALRKARSLCATVNELILTPVGEVSVSIGCCCCGPDKNYEQCVISADKALYAAKENGRNRVEAGE